MTNLTLETFQTKKIGDFFALPADEFLVKAHVDLGFDDQLVALNLWVHRDKSVLEIEQHAEQNHIPFEGLVGGLTRLYEVRLWTMSPIQLGAAIEGIWINDDDVSGIETTIDNLKRGDCACGNCLPPPKTETVH